MFTPKVASVIRDTFYKRLTHLMRADGMGDITRIPEGLVVHLSDPRLDVVVKVVVKKEAVDVDAILSEVEAKNQEKAAQEAAKQKKKLADAAKRAKKEAAEAAEAAGQ